MSIKIEVNIDGALEKLDVKNIADPLKNIFRDEVLRLEAEIKETAPVDTGRYRSAWHSEISDLEAQIANNVKYAKYLIYGTKKFRRVKEPHKYKKADLERGILHDVRAILHEWEHDFRRLLSRLIR
ncbi:hypothetical protein Asulf_01531 [Archaeoglobus sulfaticallidus PM70-1]|uniref:HK97 gp10 family phage protein n=1 Tax=Archaeoglobus sulfaticallidus PM70-1 TaxID=387631 RepID=N0BD36_9EURY|nr:HK97 gp10 family phage protein [Archaeoglobus sulfaticallidus]AGK61509.1 hypothetical protein Asulf_01531 [Archaeoglobus sulfaticallidus PM70-1]